MVRGSPASVYFIPYIRFLLLFLSQCIFKLRHGFNYYRIKHVYIQEVCLHHYSFRDMRHADGLYFPFFRAAGGDVNKR
jgi:hypothetical protein